MAGTTITVGELLYEVKVSFTKVTEYGLSMAAFLTRQKAPGPAGARIDVAFEGSLTGPKLKGRCSGVDYIHIRADGHVRLHIHAAIATDDGEQIAFFADGTGAPEEGTGLLKIHENVTLSTSSPAYAWVNQLHIWAQGTVDPAKGEVTVKGYVA